MDTCHTTCVGVFGFVVAAGLAATIVLSACLELDSINSMIVCNDLSKLANVKYCDFSMVYISVLVSLGTLSNNISLYNHSPFVTVTYAPNDLII